MFSNFLNIFFFLISIPLTFVWSIPSGCEKNEFLAQCIFPPKKGAIQPLCDRTEPSCDFPDGRDVDPDPGCFCRPACLCAVNFVRRFDNDPESECVPKCECKENEQIQRDCNIKNTLTVNKHKRVLSKVIKLVRKG